MRTILRLPILLIIILFSHSASAFDIGYNEAWYGFNYRTSLTKDFDLNLIHKIHRDIKSAGGDVIRIWLFPQRDGMILNQYAPQTAGIDPKMLENIDLAIRSAKQYKLKIYITFLDGNAMPTEKGEVRNYFYNLLNNKYGETDAFLKNVATPILKVMAKHKSAIYGLDLMNEIQAPMHNMYWGFTFDNYTGPRKWMKRMVQFVKAEAPWLQVTSSSGWGWGAKDLKNGLFSNLGLDFYDVHVYDDDGDIPFMYDICRMVRAENMRVILGEFGQKTQVDDDQLQLRATENFLKNAKSDCFSGALAWRFDMNEKTWSFQRKDGSFRPAVEVMKRY
ncbi:MAG: hypothetical protein AB7O96_03165 [Pseudobdellovibrionaceae bacterium]